MINVKRDYLRDTLFGLTLHGLIKPNALVAFSRTPRITCRWKRAKPTVAGQVHADVMRTSGALLASSMTFLAMAVA
jgi:hypothetical protein